MKKLSGNKFKVVADSSDYASVLKFLPLEVTELLSSLLPEDLEILAYLIACSSETQPSSHHWKRGKKGQCEAACHKPAYNSVFLEISQDTSKLAPTSPMFNVAVQLRKPALFKCNCFQCYTSYWRRWDSSPNRGKIDEAITLYEEHIEMKKYQRKSKAEKGEKKIDGKGRSRRAQEKVKQEASADVNVATAIKDQHLSGMSVKMQRQGREPSNPVKNSCGIKQAASGSSRSSVKTQAKILQSSSKNKLSSKDTRVKSSRVAPLVVQSANENLKEDGDLDAECKEDTSVLNRGKKLVDIVASRLWGLWDRRVN